MKRSSFKTLRRRMLEPKKPRVSYAAIKREWNQKKERRCKCGVMYTRFNTLQDRCVQCLIAKGRKLKLKAMKENLRKLSWYAGKAQDAFNAFIRARDKDLPCISCNRYHQGQYHAGHYFGRKAYPELRFDEDNVHKQCKPCNKDLSGNITEYRKGLIKKIGAARFEALEGPHPPKHYTRDDLEALAHYYRGQMKKINQPQRSEPPCSSLPGVKTNPSNSPSLERK